MFKITVTVDSKQLTRLAEKLAGMDDVQEIVSLLGKYFSISQCDASIQPPGRLPLGGEPPTNEFSQGGEPSLSRDRPPSEEVESNLPSTTEGSLAKHSTNTSKKTKGNVASTTFADADDADEFQDDESVPSFLARAGNGHSSHVSTKQSSTARSPVAKKDVASDVDKKEKPEVIYYVSYEEGLDTVFDPHKTYYDLFTKKGYKALRNGKNKDIHYMVPKQLEGTTQKFLSNNDIPYTVQEYPNSRRTSRAIDPPSASPISAKKEKGKEKVKPSPQRHEENTKRPREKPKKAPTKEKTTDTPVDDGNVGKKASIKLVKNKPWGNYWTEDTGLVFIVKDKKGIVIGSQDTDSKEKGIASVLPLMDVDLQYCLANGLTYDVSELSALVNKM